MVQGDCQVHGRAGAKGLFSQYKGKWGVLSPRHGCLGKANEESQKSWGQEETQRPPIVAWGRRKGHPRWIDILDLAERLRGRRNQLFPQERDRNNPPLNSYLRALTNWPAERNLWRTRHRLGKPRCRFRFHCTDSPFIRGKKEAAGGAVRGGWAAPSKKYGYNEGDADRAAGDPHPARLNDWRLEHRHATQISVNDAREAGAILIFFIWR